MEPVDATGFTPLDHQLFRRIGGGVAYAPGEFVFRAGEVAEQMYVVGEGSVDLLDGDRLVETVTPGSPFGELGLIDGSPRALDARASGRALVAPISAERFTWLVDQRPDFALSLLRLLAHRLRTQTGT